VQQTLTMMHRKAVQIIFFMVVFIAVSFQSVCARL
jgi:hypothetical protein